MPHLRCCPVCDSRACEDLGPIIHPTPPTVAGVPIDLDGRTFRLRGCGRCGFQFKDPPPPAEALARCYARASPDHWEERPNPRKRRFDVLRDLIQLHARGRRILDVGCFNGAFLEYLGASWDRFGVEPSTEASALAARRGIRVLAPRLEEMPPGAGPFDVILAIDVLEHLIEPRPFFEEVRPRLGPGGLLVVGTGDTQSRAWRLHGSRYWYCSLPEHVSFFSDRTLRFIAEASGLDTLAHERMSHVRSHVTTRWRQALANLADAALVRAGGLGLAPLKRRALRRGAPGWLTARDHLIQVMQVPTGSA